MTCGLCGHEVVWPGCGMAGVWVDGVSVRLCHADDHDCYGQWTLAHPEDWNAL